MTRREELQALLERRYSLTHGRAFALVPALRLRTLRSVQERIEEIAKEIDNERRGIQVDPETGVEYDAESEIDALWRDHGGEA